MAISIFIPIKPMGAVRTTQKTVASGKDKRKPKKEKRKNNSRWK